MMFKLSSSLVLVFTLVVVHTQRREMSEDDLTINVFSTTPPHPVPHPVPMNTGESGVYKLCGIDKECVPRHFCLDGAIISNTDENFIDISINDESTCLYNEICCHIRNKTTQPVIPPLPLVVHGGCGWRNKDGIGYRITVDNDNESQFGEFPWMVAILRTEDSGNEIIYFYDCGGSLIAANVVMTASHCVINRVAKQLVVRGGEWDTQNTNEILPHVDKRVREIIRHEKYNRYLLCNDVALLILEDPFEWQENIRPVCLPEANVNIDFIRCYTTGWGKNRFADDGLYQVILRKIDLPIVQRDTCQANLRQTRLGKHFVLHESFICAGGEKGKDNCKGDGGSPLVCPIRGENDRYYQAGIVSWSIGCAQENITGVYANVPYLRSWFSEKLRTRGISFADFTP